jgi:Domain of unknown function (DUF4265)
MSDKAVKIAFNIVDEDDGSVVTETMWARREVDGTYLLDNSPFYAFNVSYMDRLSATDMDGVLVFTGVVERGGHSTYRVKMNGGAGHREFLRHWPQLALLGCTYEGGGGERRLYSIDIPRASAVKTAYTYFEKLEKDGVWEFEEAHYFSGQ